MRQGVRWGAWVPVAVLVLAAVGCTSDAADTPRIVQPGAPGEDTREITLEELRELRELDRASHSPVDVAFMQGMMLHHVQALQMTRMVPDRTDREDVPLLARRIDLSQEAEIEQMRQWLLERGEPIPSLLAEHDHDDVTVPDDELEPGMLTQDQLRQLGEATGAEFDRLFLEFMIFHHEGALQMVDDLFTTGGGGTDVAVSVFANHVVADQTIEIGRMQRMLAELDGASGTAGG